MFVFVGGIELFQGNIRYVFTVWYACAPVACEVHSIYGSQPDTKSSCRSLSRLIDRYHNCASIFSISKYVLTLQIVSFISFDSTVAFGMIVACCLSNLLKWFLL